MTRSFCRPSSFTACRATVGQGTHRTDALGGITLWRGVVQCCTDLSGTLFRHALRGGHAVGRAVHSQHGARKARVDAVAAASEQRGAAGSNERCDGDAQVALANGLLARPAAASTAVVGAMSIRACQVATAPRRDGGIATPAERGWAAQNQHSDLDSSTSYVSRVTSRQRLGEAGVPTARLCNVEVHEPAGQLLSATAFNTERGTL
eukprot:scaffold25904_cov67-Phaeocystis_antarctica.AAC.1